MGIRNASAHDTHRIGRAALRKYITRILAEPKCNRVSDRSYGAGLGCRTDSRSARIAVGNEEVTERKRQGTCFTIEYDYASVAPTIRTNRPFEKAICSNTAGDGSALRGR